MNDGRELAAISEDVVEDGVKIGILVATEGLPEGFDIRPQSQRCSHVEFEFPTKLMAKLGVELAAQGEETWVQHANDRIRVYAPSNVSIYLEGQKEAYALASALICAGTYLRKELDKYTECGGVRNEENDHYWQENDFPWDLTDPEEPVWRHAWEVAAIFDPDQSDEDSGSMIPVELD